MQWAYNKEFDVFILEHSLPASLCKNSKRCSVPYSYYIRGFFQDSPWDSCRPYRWTVRRMNPRDTFFLILPANLDILFDLHLSHEFTGINRSRVRRMNVWAQFFNLYLQILKNGPIPCTYRVNSRDYFEESFEIQAKRTGERMHPRDALFLPLFANFDQMFDLHLSHDSTGFTRRKSLRFMQSVQVNGAAHESSGHTFSTSICKYGQIVRSAPIA